MLIMLVMLIDALLAISKTIMYGSMHNADTMRQVLVHIIYMYIQSK